MAISAHAIAGRAAAAGLMFLSSWASAAPAGQSAPAGEASAAGSAPSTVSGGGVTLHSVSVDFPDRYRTFSGGASADAINNNCLACHSAGMVLYQPSLPKAEWEAEVHKMRTAYEAPVDPNDIDAIVNYLAEVKAEN